MKYVFHEKKMQTEFLFFEFLKYVQNVSNINMSKFIITRILKMNLISGRKNQFFSSEVH